MPGVRVDNLSHDVADEPGANGIEFARWIRMQATEIAFVGEVRNQKGGEREVMIVGVGLSNAGRLHV